ncbi:type II toxin-antitoxin system RelE/ParE family toxin [Granulicella cerasi]|uniref:Type II toxin-antitoxin system RelE/ParE family toxin n=1 Tax=Granulicella cerasi TaxID=741063 RepID=A0ABW1Z996_9BACT|nr:type II toxin-antitoxin system RelE/ParE family toxin [Granulicella cerasi]
MAKNSARKLELTARADVDLLEVMAWSEAEFGESAAEIYEHLLAQALFDLSMDAFRPGSTARPEILDGVHSYHLRFSRDHVSGERVKRPRDLLLFQVTDEAVIVLRVLHDSRDLKQHMS